MKIPIIAITLGTLTLLAAGCKPADDKPAQSTSEQLDKAKMESTAAARDMEDYTYARKAEFVTKMQGQLDGLNRDLEQLTAKIEKSSDEVKAEAKPKMEALRAQADLMAKQLDAAKNADGSTWDTVKADSKKAYKSMKDGFDDARQWVSDKIKP